MSKKKNVNALLKKPEYIKIFGKNVILFTIVALVICVGITIYFDQKWKESLLSYNVWANSVKEIIESEDLNEVQKTSMLSYLATINPYNTGRDMEIYIDDELRVTSRNPVMVYVPDVSLDDDFTIYVCTDEGAIRTALEPAYDRFITMGELGSVFSGTIFERMFKPNKISLQSDVPFTVITDDETRTFSIDFTGSDGQKPCGYLQVFKGLSGDEEFISADEISGIVKKENEDISYTIKYSDNYYLYSVFSSDTKTFVMIYLAVLISMLIICAIYSYLVYYKRKNLYDIVTYRSNLSNILSHDLKTPLMAMSVYAEDYKLTKDSSKKDYYVERVLENTRYMDDLINNALLLSKTEQGLLSDSNEDLSVAEVFDEVLELVSFMLEEKSLKVHKEGDKKIRTSKNDFKIAINCLVENAVKYSVSGGTIDIRISDSKIILKNSFEGENKDVARLKEPYVRGSKARSKVDGNGLGLAISDITLRNLGFKLKLLVSGNEFVVTIEI